MPDQHAGTPQYLGKDDYYEAVRRLALGVSNLNHPTPWPTRADPNGFSFEVRGLQLHVTLPDLYLRGVSAGGRLWVFQGTQFQIPGLTTVQMPFRETYMAMGWNKTEANVTVTLKSLNASMAAFRSGSPQKGDFLHGTGAFAEGARFAAIVRKVIAEAPITKTDVSWDDSRASVRKGP